MMQIREMTVDETVDWFKFLNGRPRVVREVWTRFPPFTLWRLKTTGQHVEVISVAEPQLTVTVTVLRKYNPHLRMERQVFGINPDDLEPATKLESDYGA